MVGKPRGIWPKSCCAYQQLPVLPSMPAAQQGLAAEPPIPRVLRHPPSNAAGRLLVQKAAISNWDAFARDNGITGWDVAVDACQWSGVRCDGGAITSL